MQTWGLTSETISGTGTPQDQTTNYDDYCSQISSASPEGNDFAGYKMCQILRASGALTLLFVILAIVFSTLLLLMLFVFGKNHAGWAKHGVSMWRAAGLNSFVSSASAVIYWICGGWIVVVWDVNQSDYFSGYTLYIGASWAMVIGAYILDVWVGWVVRRAIGCTMADGSVPPQGYAVMGSVMVVPGQIVVPQQQQYQPPGHYAQQPQQPPQGYGQPSYNNQYTR